MPKLSCIGGNVVVENGYLTENTALAAVGPFESLTRIGGWAKIDGNPNLVSIGLFDTVESIDGGTLRISDNPLLSTLGLSALRATNDDIVVSNDPKLLACPLEYLATRMQHAGWRHALVVDGDLECATGTTCAGPVCTAAP